MSPVIAILRLSSAIYGLEQTTPKEPETLPLQSLPNEMEIIEELEQKE